MELKRRTETLPGTTGETFLHSLAAGDASSVDTSIRSAPSTIPRDFFTESPGRAELSAPWERKLVLESKPQRYVGKSQLCIAMAPAVREQPLTEASAWPGAANVEQSTPNAKNAARTKAITLLDRRFIDFKFSLLSNTKSMPEQNTSRPNLSSVFVIFNPVFMARLDLLY
ncbi:MAG: hypothetical protein OEN50_18595 [Deltaproteobacteria bacterium]|nr:hypothetical protein [Deltaproteobacteria bacterium]